MPDFDKLAFPDAGSAQVIETAVRDCAVESVVVYADRAEVKRRVPVSLAAGKNEVVVFGLSTCIDKNSIRVEGKGSAVITDVIYSSKSTVEEVDKPGSKEEYKAMKEEMVSAELELARLKIKGEVLNDEKSLLDKFANHISNVHSIKGKEEGLVQLVSKDSVGAVMEFYEKYEAKVADLDSRLSKVVEDMNLVTEKISVLKENSKKMNSEMSVKKRVTVRSVHIGLETSEEVEGVLFVSYVVSQASWSSSYDVRVFTKDKTMKVQYYGFIKQQTGEDWENAKLSLSTAQPSIGGSPPDLPTRILRFRRLVPWSYHQYLQSSCNGAEDQNERAMVFYGNSKSLKSKSAGGFLSFGGFTAKAESAYTPPPPPPAIEVETAEVTTGLFNATFAIPRASTIPADNTEHKVTVALVDLSLDFHYNSVPRLSAYSFLQAKTKNTSPYTMLAGPANIFMDNNFIAKSELSDVSPNEEFTISLGVDQSLRITCQPVGVVHNTVYGFLSNSSSITFSHKFQVKNTKTHPVSIHLSEQVPLSSDDKVKVSVVEPAVQEVQEQCPLPAGHCILNESNNMEWHVTVQSGEELELSLVYNVEHPAQDYVEGLPTQ